MPKVIAKSDLNRISKFSEPAALMKAFESGKDQLTTTCKATFDDKEKVLKATITRVSASKDDGVEYKYFLICNAKDEDKHLDQANIALESAISSTVVNFCDIILAVNTRDNSYDIYNTKPPFLNIPNNRSYKEAISKFLSDIVHPDDADVAEQYFSLDAIKNRVANNELGASIMVRCKKKDRKTYVNATIVSMCYMNDDSPCCAFFIQGID